MSAHAIPPPRLKQIINGTPFPHFSFDKMAKGRAFFDVVVVCASFRLDGGELVPAALHRGPIYADTVWNPEQAVFSSLRSAGDVVLSKPASDVYLTGTAHAIGGSPTTDWAAMLRVQRGEEVLVQKVLRLTGPRRWERTMLGWSLSSPEPTASVQLRYELAYGGWWYDNGAEPDAPPRLFPANPSGTGWFGSATRVHDPRARYDRHEVVAGPQIEYFDEPIRSANAAHRAAGFGPVARHWQPRAAWAGKYDRLWRERFHRDAVPDYPADFDTRYFLCAPADQVVEGYLRGDEQIALAGLFADTPGVVARLPSCVIEATLFANGAEPVVEHLPLDTLHVDVDAREIHLTWRLSLAQSRDVFAVELMDRCLVGGVPTSGRYRGEQA